MHVAVPMCSSCNKVQDDEGDTGSDRQWVPLKDYRAKYDLRPEEVWAAHTECPSCNRQYEQFMAYAHGERVPMQPHDIVPDV